MAKYKVLKRFKDICTKEIYEVGQEVELTDKRAEEVAENLKKYNIDFLEKVEEEPKDPGVPAPEKPKKEKEVEETKEEVKDKKGKGK